jgi:hypothetical protein
MKRLMGTRITAEGCTLIDRSVNVIDDQGRFIATFVKGCLSLEFQCNARPGLLRASGDFSNRSGFAGVTQENRIRKDGTMSQRRGVPKSIVKKLGRTGILGYFDYRDSPTGEIACRQSQWTLADITAYKGVLPLVAAVDRVFMEYCPIQHAAQMVEVEKIDPAYRIGRHGFGTLTVNVDSRAAVHVDADDLPNGTAALIADGNFQGSGLVLPRFNLHFDIRAGDVLLFDPHQAHANPPLIGHRLSVVLYVRERMHLCTK